MNVIFKVIILFAVLQRYVKCVKYKTLGLPEGAKCSWQDVDGVCANPYRCLSAMEDIRRNRTPPVCSFQGVKAIICCTDCELGDLSKHDMDPINTGAAARLYKTGEKSRDKCLKYLALIGDKCSPSTLAFYTKEKHPTKNCYNTLFGMVGPAGGMKANRDQFRHMALLGYGPNFNSAQWLCGGTLISNKFILTAGHCTAAPKLGPVRYAALGILKRSDPLELWQRYLVNRIVRHPQYKPPSKYHDIALLETHTKVSFNSHVLPACLQFKSIYSFDEHLSATGWGALGPHRELADNLEVVHLDRFEPRECSSLYPPHRHLRHGYDNSTQMCYGNRKIVRDTCQGDSGGPLQSQNYLSPCVYTVAGVTSSGKPCGVPGLSGLYTRVTPYVPWIESVICSYQGVKPIICCTDCELEDITGSITLNAGVPVRLYKTGEKARDHCLDYLDLVNKCDRRITTKYLKKKHPTENCNKVILTITAAAGGLDAFRDQFRHMSLLGYGNDLDSAQWICGGSLISNKFILTAGHCIAAPKLVLFNKHVLPACLHIVPQEHSDGYANATGWGALGHNRELADTLQTVYLERLEPHECSQLYPPHRHLLQGYDHSTQMCYGNRHEIRDTCEGDSGGPLQNAHYISDCVYTIIGVTSSGKACGHAGNFGVYTRVIHYVPWIESIVWPD